MTGIEPPLEEAIEKLLELMRVGREYTLDEVRYLIKNAYEPKEIPENYLGWLTSRALLEAEKKGEIKVKIKKDSAYFLKIKKS